MSNSLIFRNPYFDLQPMDLISIRGGSSPKEYGQYNIAKSISAPNSSMDRA